MSFTFLCTLLPDAVCVVLLVVAAVVDLRTCRIPNLLTFGGVAAGLLMNCAPVVAVQGFETALRLALLPSVAGAVLLCSVFLALAAVGAVGMGDVKLMAAVGAFVRWPMALRVLASVLLAGAVLALLYAIRRRQLGAVSSNMARALGRLFGAKSHVEITLHHMPYALAILIGTLWALLGRYLPALRLF